MRLDHLAAHAARLCLAAVALAFAPWLAAPFFFLAAFTFAHDLSHGALRLPARVNHALLALAGALMLTSGHAMRVAHLRHHARPLAPDDLEGASVHGGFARALVWSIPWAIGVRRAAYARAPRHDRRRQRREHALTLLLATLLVLAGGAARTYALTAIALQLFAPVWAGRLPHTAPAWLVGLARRLSWTRSPTVLSLAFHDLHHAHPRVPTAALRLLKTRLLKTHQGGAPVQPGAERQEAQQLTGLHLARLA